MFAFLPAKTVSIISVVEHFLNEYLLQKKKYL